MPEETTAPAPITGGGSKKKTKPATKAPPATKASKAARSGGKYEDAAIVTIVNKDHSYRGNRAEMFKLITDGITVGKLKERHAKNSDLSGNSVAFILQDAEAKGLIKVKK